MNFDLHVFNFVSIRLNLALLFLITFCIATQVHADIPETPTGLTAVATDTGINLNWTAPSDDIVGYSIYRCEEGDTPCTPEWIAWVANEGDAPPAPTEYLDTNVTSGTTYRYAVTSNDSDYDESAWSDEVTVLAQGGTGPEPEQPMVAPAPPTGLTAVSGESGIDLSWEAPSDDIAGYSVYRCEEGDAPCTPEWIVWVANDGDTPPAPTGYSDSDVVEGTSYRYAVTSNNIDSDGEYHESEWSDEVTVLAEGGTEPEPEPETPLAAPTGLTVTETSTESVSLSWTAPADGILGYNVYRCDVPEDETICELELHAWVANEGDAPPAPTSYTDTGGETGGVTAGTTYLYAVGASYPPDYENSEQSEAVTTVTQVEVEPEPEQPTVPPAPPTGLTAVSGESGIDLSWEAPSDDIAGYSVYRCEEGDAPCTPEWIVWVANDGDTPPAPTGYSDSDVVEGTSYRYAVTSNNIDSDGEYHESDWSDEVTVPAEGGTEPEPEPETPLAAPTGLTVTETSAESVSLSWTAPADGILGYNVYRCDVPEDETICELELHAWVANEGDAPPAPTSYTDTGGETGGVTAGTTYLYAVGASYPPDYQNSEQSETVTAVTQVGTDMEPEEPETPDTSPGFADEAAIDDLVFVVGTAIEPITLPKASGGNVDTALNNGELSDYSLDPAELPEGLGFDQFTRVLSGTPTMVTAKTTYTLRVHDDDDNYDASDAGSLSFTIQVEMAEVAPVGNEEALEDVTATIGRNMLSSVISTIGNRFTAPSDTSEISLAGRQLTLDEFVERMSSETGWDSIKSGGGYPELVAGRDLSFNEFGIDQGTPPNYGQTLSWRQLLGDSSFLMSFGEGGANNRKWTLWGSGNIQSFDSDSHDGDIYTGYLGADLRIKENWLAGVSVSHSVGEADYAIDDQAGELETELTTVLPYARFQLNNHTEVWAILGAGWGEADHDNGVIQESSDLSVALGAFGGRRTFGEDSGGMNWAIRADAAFIRLWTDDGMQSVDDLSVKANRLHLGLEASYPFELANSGMVRPFVEAGVRHDGGDGNNTGAGLELVSGLRYESDASGFWLEARGRVLVLHSADDDYEERGFSLTAGLQPSSDGTGLSFLLSPQWGRPIENMESMWRGSDTFNSLNRNLEARQHRGGSLRVEFSYGFARPRTGGVVAPFGELEVADETSHRARLGTRYHLLADGFELKVELSSNVGIRTMRNNTWALDNGMNTDHDVWLKGELRF